MAIIRHKYQTRVETVLWIDVDTQTMLVALQCPNCKGSIELDDEREFGFCIYCGCKVVLTDNLKKKIVVSHDVELDSAKKLRDKYVAQRDWNGAFECCRTIVKYDESDWRTWLILASEPDTPSMWHICLDNAIEHCDDPVVLEYLEELRDSYSVVLLSHYEAEFLVGGSPLTYSLPFTFDNSRFGGKAGFNQKLEQCNSAVVVKNGVHTYYNYKSRMNSRITISKDVTLSFDDDLVITWRQATGKIQVDKFPTLVTGPINSGCKIEEFAFIPDLKVFIAEPEEMDNVHLQVDGYNAKIITKDGKQFFYIRPCATISNANYVKELHSSVKDSGTLGDKRLSLKKVPITYKRRLSLFKSETVETVRYELVLEELSGSPIDYIGFAKLCADLEK